MLRPRIIPCLLLQDGRLVKTVGFAEPKYVGDPINAVRIFNEKEVDELIVLDIGATPSGSEPNLQLIAQLAAECRMPLCYGGGVRSVEQAKRIVGLGVEKVAVSSAAISDRALVSRLADEIGRQSVVVVLDVSRGADGYGVMVDRGRRRTAFAPVELAQEMEAAGAGEIVINSVDSDGKMTGYDLDLAVTMRRALRIPLTVLGGAGSLDHIEQLLEACGVVGAAAGSLFVFKGIYRAVLINYPRSEQKEELLRATMDDGDSSSTDPVV